MEALWILQARKNASLRDLPRESGRKGTRKGWSLIDGTKGQGQRSSGGEGETADPDLHPHQPNTSRSPDQPCEVCVSARGRARTRVCVGGWMEKWALGVWGERNGPSRAENRSYLGAKVHGLQTLRLREEGHELLMYPCRVQGKADEKGG